MALLPTNPLQQARMAYASACRALHNAQLAHHAAPCATSATHYALAVTTHAAARAAYANAQRTARAAQRRALAVALATSRNRWRALQRAAGFAPMVRAA